MKRLIGTVMIGLLAMGAAGCSDSGGGGGKPADTTLFGMLHSVPDTEANRLSVLVYGNLARVRDGDSKGSGAADLKMLIDRTDGEVTLPSAIQNGIIQDEFRGFAGFDTRNIDAALEYGNLPDAVAVLAGHFDAGKVKKALASSPGGDGLQAESADGVERLGLANDVGNRSTIRSIGQQLEIAVDSTTLVWARTVEAVDQCLAVRATSGSLADDTAYGAVATVLDGAVVTSAQITAPSAGETWVLAGIGEVRKGKKSTLTVVLQYPDAASATDAVTAFRDHIDHDESLRTGDGWNDLVEITDLRNVGATMVATLTTERAGLGRSVILTGDNLLQFG